MTTNTAIYMSVIDNNLFTGMENTPSYLNDKLAELGGIEIGQAYRNGSNFRQRINSDINQRGPIVDCREIPGYDETGVTDSYAAIVSGLAHVASLGGGTLLIPGTPSISAGIVINVNGVSLSGGGMDATILTATFGTGNIITVDTCGSVTISDMIITSSVARTSGACIRMTNSHNCTIERIRVDTPSYDAFILDGGASQFLYTIRDFEINGGFRGIVIGTDSTLPQDIWIQRGIIAGTTDAALHMIHASGIYVNSVDITQCKYGVYTTPASGQYVVAFFANQLFADTSDTSGWVIAPASGAIVAGWSCSNCWSCGADGAAIHDAGIVIDGTSGGSIYGISFQGALIMNNRGPGVLILGSSARKISFMGGCQIGGNSAYSAGTRHGVEIGADVSDITITGNMIGAVQIFAPPAGPDSHGYGVLINAGTSTRCMVRHNNLHGNVTGTVIDGSSGTNSIGDNVP